MNDEIIEELQGFVDSVLLIRFTFMTEFLCYVFCISNHI